MVGAELHAATDSAIAVGQQVRGTQRHGPAQSHLPHSTAVDLKRTKPDMPPNNKPPSPDIIILEISLARRRARVFFCLR
jgi:hypothetical protein